MPDIKKFISAFDSFFYVNPEMVVAEVKCKGMFNFIYEELMFKIDFIVLKDDEFERLKFKRKQFVQTEDVKYWIISPEDLILSKLSWAKESESEVQLRDVGNIVDAVDNLDMEYLRRWATELKLNATLKKILSKKNE